jgi:WD40 repeat protein
MGMRFAAIILAVLAVFAARAQEPYVPMLDTGGHMALINGIAFTPDGSQLVSGSGDKTIRVWDVAAGKPLRTIRGEAAPGSAGGIYAIALSPDGKWLAAGGWMKIPGEPGHHIRLYDFASGKLVALLKGHADVVHSLAFSPDGRNLISGSADKTAIVWDMTTREARHRLEGHKDDIHAVGFSPDGTRAVTGSNDHDLRLWSVDSGDLLQTMQGHQDKVRSLAIAPDGTIASGDWLGEIHLWDGRTGAFLKILAQQNTEAGSLSFSQDGKMLLSGVIAPVGPFYCHVYELASGREIVTYRGHNNIVAATAISPDGRWAATGGGQNNEIHIWDLLTGTRRQGPDWYPLNLGGTGRPAHAAGFSANGLQIAWGNTDAGSRSVNSEFEPYEQSLTLPLANEAPSGPQALSYWDKLLRSLSLRPAWTRGAPRHDAWSLSSRKGGTYGFQAILDIREGETVRAFIERGPTNGYGHWSYSFTSDGETVVSGGANGVIAAYALDGDKLCGFTGHEGLVWAVTPSPDGRYLVSGSDDQTVRLWSLDSCELLVTIFRGSDGEWVMWTPQGYYTASPRGGELIGWQINRGPENAAGYVTAGKLREFLDRPDIVTQAIALASAKEAAAKAPKTGRSLEDLLAATRRVLP